MHPNLELSISGLFIERADRVLCDNFSCQVSAGEIARIMGENGAGKSTLLKIIAGVLQPLEGKIMFAGEDISYHRDILQKELLYLGHHAGIKAVFSAAENLSWYCPTKSKDAIEEALTEVGLGGYLDTPAHQLSAGQQRRIALARLWLTDKKVWLLDEPFTALDVKGVAVLEQRLKQHLDKGGMIILTTHQSLDDSLNIKEIKLTS
ncbi:cytochrome c biogenesis heme-transporting ATPase CcmA [Marinomonas sp. MED121]|uniref:cytochrome c biogenesis heme-transporting ATPase CcmA n=1 Tax=Marinomonas sp. MED121 TaxID=314277 RepID=UPI00030B91B2|nr:cytochrome c biogenesis heme-transporting ATPase CcmA [Marinomonas sp. MED121]